MTTGVKCPILAVPPAPQFISMDNMNMTLVSTYERTVGTTVNFTCHVPQYYSLHGAPVLTCLATAKWDYPAPTCELTTATTTSVETTITNSAVVREDQDVSMLPYIIGTVLVAAACIIIAISLLVVLLWKWKRRFNNKYSRHERTKLVKSKRIKRRRRNKGRKSTNPRMSDGSRYQSGMVGQYPYVQEYPAGSVWHSALPPYEATMVV